MSSYNANKIERVERKLQPTKQHRKVKRNGTANRK
nr:MAG TPA: hypothetical protein [Caudoviricetes sp.]